MFSTFFAEGGWPMYWIAGFGFLTVATSIFYALGLDARMAHLVLMLGVVTLSSGIFGTALGICLSCRYIAHVPHEKQLEVLAAGCDESLHDILFSMIFVALGAMVVLLGVLRGIRGARADSMLPIAGR
jgi:hypothetical protein